MARTATQESVETNIAQVVGEVLDTPADTIVGYNADGETVAMPVDRTPLAQGGLPGIEDDQPVELFEGRPVQAWKYGFTGNTQIDRMSRSAAALFDSLRVEQPITLLITVMPGSVSYDANTEDGHVVGFTRKRKMHVTEVYAADASAAELFEGGLMRVRMPDDIGYMTTEAPEGEPEPEGNNLASSLMAAGLCGKVHPGHLNKCRNAAHACELPEAE